MVTRYDIDEKLDFYPITQCLDGNFVHIDDYERAESRISDLEDDANRYRWLRDRLLSGVSNRRLFMHIARNSLSTIHVDSVIDELMECKL